MSPREFSIHEIQQLNFEEFRKWFEQELAEAQAETVERIVDYIGNIRSAEGLEYGAVAQRVRALSPDPHARERWEFEARLETTERIEGLCIARTTADAKALHDYIAELRSQLPALPKEGK